VFDPKVDARVRLIKPALSGRLVGTGHFAYCHRRRQPLAAAEEQGYDKGGGDTENKLGHK
jgi:hypothetical protein